MPRKAKPTMVEVNVNRDMIDHALTQRSTLCAIALAIRDADVDGDFERPWITQNRIAFTNRRTDERYEFEADQIPDEIKTWIDQFDRNPSKVKPFSFTLDLSQAKVIKRKHDAPLEAIKKRAEYEKLRERRTTQKKIPRALEGIRNTSKRELRDVDV